MLPLQAIELASKEVVPAMHCGYTVCIIQDFFYIFNHCLQNYIIPLYLL